VLTVREVHFRGPKRLRELLGHRFHSGVVPHYGEHVASAIHAPVDEVR
jgi:hypothetical protein